MRKGVLALRGSHDADTTASRFTGLNRSAALVLILATLGFIVLGLVTGAASTDGTAPHPDATDVALYERITDRVLAGEDYYAAATAEQRASNYPVRPFVTVRPPALATFTDLVGGPSTAHVFLIGIAIAACGTVMVRLSHIAPGRIAWGLATAITAAALIIVLDPPTAAVHELWAAPLIVLAVFLRTPDRWILAVLCGFLAAIVRELAIPVLIAMAAAAAYQHQRREMTAWMGATVIALAFLAVHALRVHAVTEATDPGSQGWVRLGGWGFSLETVQESSALLLAPSWVTAVVVPLALVGWLGRRSSTATRIMLIVSGYFAMFAVVGRPENAYWGLLVVSLVLPGITFAPRAACDLWRSACGPNTFLPTA